MCTPTNEWKPEKVLACNRCRGLLTTVGLTPHICDTSVKEYNAKRTVVAIKLYQCDLCPARMPQSGNIRSHRRRHLQEKIHCCTHQIPSLYSSGLVLCGKRFADPTALVRHRKNKHGYVPGSSKLKRSNKSAHYSPYESLSRSSRTVKIEDDDELEKLSPLAFDAPTPSSTSSSSYHDFYSPRQVKILPRSPKLTSLLAFEERTPSPSYSCSSFASPSTSPHPQSPISDYPTTSPCESSTQLTQFDLDQLLLNQPLFDGLIQGYHSGFSNPDDFVKVEQPLINFSQIYGSESLSCFATPSPPDTTSFVSFNDWSPDCSDVGSPSYSAYGSGEDCSYPSPCSDATSPSSSPSPSPSPSSASGDLSPFSPLSAYSDFLFS